MCVLSFEDGMTAASWYAWLAFRRRVSMSAIGSVIVMVCGASLAAVPHVSRVLRWSWACRRSVVLWCDRGECPGRMVLFQSLTGDHQLDLRTPGSSPAWAISRRQIRQRPNLRKTEW